MAAFVRFVFTILMVGMAINLVVVFLANGQSQRRQRQQYQEQSQRFKEMLVEVEGRSRRVDIVVEGQRVDARGKVLESTLLLRQYRGAGTNQDAPLPVVRIVIPGDKLEAGGLVLKFGKEFASESGEFQMLQEAQLALFGRFCGAGEPGPIALGETDDRFSFLLPGEVPQLMRLDPLARQASFFELKVWQYIWEQVPAPPRDAKLPWSPPELRHVKATWTQPATITVRRVRENERHTYTAFIGASGEVTLSEDEPGLTSVWEDMLLAGQELDASGGK